MALGDRGARGDARRFDRKAPARREKDGGDRLRRPPGRAREVYDVEREFKRRHQRGLLRERVGRALAPPAVGALLQRARFVGGKDRRERCFQGLNGILVLIDDALDASPGEDVSSLDIGDDLVDLLFKERDRGRIEIGLQRRGDLVVERIDGGAESAQFENAARGFIA